MYVIFGPINLAKPQCVASIVDTKKTWWVHQKHRVRFLSGQCLMSHQGLVHTRQRYVAKNCSIVFSTMKLNEVEHVSWQNNWSACQQRRGARPVLSLISFKPIFIPTFIYFCFSLNSLISLMSIVTLTFINCSQNPNVFISLLPNATQSCSNPNWLISQLWFQLLQIVIFTKILNFMCS